MEVHVEPQRRVAALHDAHRPCVRPRLRGQPELLLRATAKGAAELHDERLEHGPTEIAVVPAQHPQSPRQRADPLPYRYLGDHLLDEVHGRVAHAATEAGGAETPALAREGDETLEAASLAADAYTSVLEQAAAEHLGRVAGRPRCENAPSPRLRCHGGHALRAVGALGAVCMGRPPVASHRRLLDEALLDSRHDSRRHEDHPRRRAARAGRAPRPAQGAVLHEGNGLDAFALEVDGLVHRVAELAQVPTKESLDAYYAAYVEARPAREQMLSAAAPLGLKHHVEAADVDLVVLTDHIEISRASRRLKQLLVSAATSTARHTVAFHGGREDLDISWNAALGTWSGHQLLREKWRNVFGVDIPKPGVALGITVEINVPPFGVDRKVGGAFARCRASGRTYLVHRGKIGGAKGVGAEVFWSRFRGGVLMEEPEGERSRVVPVACLDGPGALADLAGFVHEVGRIKRLAGKQQRG